MRRLKAIALSDLHLGEREGLLWHQAKHDAIQITVDRIRDLAEGGDSIEDGAEELVLVGDIVDLSEASEEEAFGNAAAFFGALLKQVDVDKIVYIPGNHDHHMWVEMLKQHQGKRDFKDCRPKTGGEGVAPALFVNSCLPSEYRNLPVEVRYPYYILETDSSFYFFDHGHLFSKFLSALMWLRHPKSTEDLEDDTYEMMEGIWWRTRSRWREILYEIFRLISLRAGKSKRKTKFREDCAPVYDDYIRAKIIWYLEEICAIGRTRCKDAFSKDFHFVFGHTHQGGRVLKVDRKFRIAGRFISVWNTGGWLVPSDVFSPDAYIFYIENTSEGPRPGAYKLVQLKNEPNWVGNYPHEVLEERLGEVAK
jgi:hypothetical protein